jgi:tRNA(Ile)-lysidine synthase
MPSLIQCVVRTVRREGLLRPGARVVAAVSGGSDSVALVRLLVALAGELKICVAGLAHVNHGLRGVASDADEQFCRQLAAEVGLAIHVARVEVRRSVDGMRLSPEDAARRARYAALRGALRHLSADILAIGHTRDDQAETVLLTLIRGAGTRGTAGIHPRNGVFERPLLDVGRQELRNWLQVHEYRWVDDESNADLRIPRNVVRHVVLPAMTTAAHYDVVGPLSRHAAIARADDEVLETLAVAAAARTVTRADGTIRLSGPAVAVEPVAIQRRIVLKVLREAGVTHPGFEAVEAVRELASGMGSSLQFKGRIRAHRIGADVVLTSSRPGIPAPARPFRYSLAIPGCVIVSEAGMAVSAQPREDDGSSVGATAEAIVDAEAIGQTVIVRNWMEGDALRPAGLGGRKKLQDVFVDRKVPRGERIRLPLVANSADHVVWVPGLALDEGVRVTERTKAVVVLKLSQVIR